MKKCEMKEGTLLTLAMSERRKNEYQFIGYLREKGEFTTFYTDTLFINAKPVLDIGAYSKIKYSEKNSHEIRLGADMCIVKSLGKDEFINFIENKKCEISNFQRLKDNRFAIVELRCIEEIELNKKDEDFNCYLKCIINGKKLRLKIKDYRWLNYWKNLYKENPEKVEERKEFYREFFTNRKTYLLLFRYKNQVMERGQNRFTSDIYWIASIFYR